MLRGKALRVVHHYGNTLVCRDRIKDGNNHYVHLDFNTLLGSNGVQYKAVDNGEYITHFVPIIFDV